MKKLTILAMLALAAVISLTVPVCAQQMLSGGGYSMSGGGSSSCCPGSGCSCNPCMSSGCSCNPCTCNPCSCGGSCGDSCCPGTPGCNCGIDCVPMCDLLICKNQCPAGDTVCQQMCNSLCVARCCHKQ
ncbi:MAG TPA: hypothetical protein VK436_02420 [Methanocella sp.]|nr:hypothetical protein [Methanocella sp.]